MSALNDLISQISDPALRERIQQEVNKMAKQKKFGLVFEEHLPETTRLYDLPIKRGSNVVLKSDNTNSVYKVITIKDEMAKCVSKSNPSSVEDIPINDLVCIAELGEPIYPYLEPIDSICNAPDSDLWHTLIEADNYHALQLLEYLYGGKIDCIYIDPPYNTGAKDWKYNNDYVDGSDAYRHSKWLSFMEKRLELAKKLLNPKDSVLIVTIDEKEYHHLACLLEELFPEARVQMVSVAIHSSGVARSEFSRTDEYYYFVFFGDAQPSAQVLGDEWKEDGVKRQSSVRWESLLRSGVGSRRTESPNLFYPIFFEEKTGEFVGFGETIPLDVSGKDFVPPKGTVAVLPYASDGTEARWRISAERADELKRIGAFDWGDFKGAQTALKYLKQGELKKIENGEYEIIGKKDNGAMIISSENYEPKWIPGTQWHVSTHQAGGNGGSNLLKAILCSKRFDYPKSVYAVRDALKFILSAKQNAIVVDFFAGSGTTMHATQLLNAEDGGSRRCICVTNNEVSNDDVKTLEKKGFVPGDNEWEALGIARYVTWPRILGCIKGCNVKGTPLKGNYYGSERKISDGFETNANYFKLSFLEKNAVALGKELKKMIPLLWFKAGAKGKCPDINSFENEELLIFADNHFAILLEETAYPSFKDIVNENEDIETVYICTDSEAGYREMITGLRVANTYQLYRDYLDNFRINTERR